MDSTPLLHVLFPFSFFFLFFFAQKCFFAVCACFFAWMWLSGSDQNVIALNDLHLQYCNNCSKFCFAFVLIKKYQFKC